MVLLVVTMKPNPLLDKGINHVDQNMLFGLHNMICYYHTAEDVPKMLKDDIIDQAIQCFNGLNIRSMEHQDYIAVCWDLLRDNASKDFWSVHQDECHCEGSRTQDLTEESATATTPEELNIGWISQPIFEIDLSVFDDSRKWYLYQVYRPALSIAISNTKRKLVITPLMCETYTQDIDAQNPPDVTSAQAEDSSVWVVVTNKRTKKQPSISKVEYEKTRWKMKPARKHRTGNAPKRKHSVGQLITKAASNLGKICEDLDADAPTHLHTMKRDRVSLRTLDPMGTMERRAMSTGSF